MTKQARLFAIREVISAKTVANQDELRLELKKRGFDVTQATLSRDLKELGVGRVSTPDGGRYVVQPAGETISLRPIVAAEILSMTTNENIIVIKTLPGCANSVGEFVDVQQHPDVLGTIAGDNTLLVIPSSGKKTKLLITYLKRILIEGKQ